MKDYCQLVKENAQLYREQRNLALRMKNEEMITSILLNPNISDSNKTFLHEFLGGKKTFNNALGSGFSSLESMIDNIVKINKQLHAEGFPDELKGQLNLLTSALVIAVSNNSTVNAKLQTVVLNKPDPKYSAIDFTKSPEQIVNAVIMLAGDRKITARQGRISETLKSVNAAIEAENSKVKKDKLKLQFLNSKKETLESQIDNKDILDALEVNELLLKQDSYHVFPTIAAAHKNHIASADRVKGEKIHYAYNGSIKLGVDDNNNLVAQTNSREDKNTYKTNNDYTPSALAMLLGTYHHTANAELDAVNIPMYLKNSIKINAVSYMESIYKVLAYDIDSTDFHDAWGLDKYSSDYNERYNDIVALHLSGTVPQSVILQSLGKDIYRSLPVKFSNEADSNLEQLAITELGLYAINFMRQSGLAYKEDDVSTITFNDGTKTQKKLRVNMGTEIGVAMPSVHIQALVSALQYLDMSDARKETSTEPILDVQKTIRNSFMDLPKKVHDKILAMQSKPLKFTSDMEAIYALYKSGDKGKEAAYAMAGILQVDEKNDILKQTKEMTKNNYSKLVFDDMIRMYEKHWGDEEFYLNYSYTVSGRYMIESLLNPQESKVTRFLVTSEDLRTTLHKDPDRNVFNKKDMATFRTSVAQAFDLDPDKAMDSEVEKKLSKIVTISDNGSVSFSGSIDESAKDYNVFYHASMELNKLESMAHRISVASDVRNNAALTEEEVKGIQAIDKSIEQFNRVMLAATRKGSGFHTIQAIMALKNLSKYVLENKDGISDYVSNITLESDAITSGMILTLMGIGTKEALELASKGGVYTKDVIAMWEDMADEFNEIASAIGINTFEKLKRNDNGDFKLTHGWLLSFSKRVESIIDPNNTETYNQEFVDEFNKKLSDRDISSFAKFADVYNTVGKDANAGLINISKTMSEEIKAIEVEISAATIYKNLSSDQKVIKQQDNIISGLETSKERLLDNISMSKFIGTITRSLAKPPVMVYIYGAMLSSIKKKLTSDIVAPKIYEILNHDAFKDTEFKDFINMLKPENKEFASAIVDEDRKNSEENSKEHKITEDAIRILRLMFSDYINPNQEKKVAFPSFKILSQDKTIFVDDSSKKMSSMFISDAMLRKLQKTSEATLGAAFEKGFKQFGVIDKYRESIKIMEVTRFTMFKYAYDKAIKNVISTLTKNDDGSYAISRNDVSKVIYKLEQSGFGHSVEDINDGKQPLYKSEQLAKEIYAVLAYSTGGAAESQIQGKAYAPNTGASGVITVHNIDGFIDSSSSAMFNLIRIYDGSVSGINALDASQDAYNESTMHATVWSSYNTQANLLYKNILQMEEDGTIQDMLDTMNTHDQDNLINTLEKLMDFKDVEFIDQAKIDNSMENTKSRIAENIAIRTTDVTELHILHSYVQDSLDPKIMPMSDGSQYAIKEGAVEAIYGLYSGIIKSLVKRTRFVKYGDETIDLEKPPRKILTADKKTTGYSIRGEYDTSDGYKNPIYLYADNLDRTGPDDRSSVAYSRTKNTIGIPINVSRTSSQSSMTDEEVNTIIHEIDNAFARIPKDRDVYLPLDFFGVRGSDLILDERINNHLKNKMDELFLTNTNRTGHVYTSSTKNSSSSATSEPHGSGSNNDVTVQSEFYNRNKVAKDTEHTYIFGENTYNRLAYGVYVLDPTSPQADGFIPKSTQAVIRGLPNAFGIDTRKSMEQDYAEKDFDMYVEDLDKVFKFLELQRKKGKKFIVPADGIGTGKANLPISLYNALADRMNKFVGNPNYMAKRAPSGSESTSNQDYTDLDTYIEVNIGKTYKIKYPSSKNSFSVQLTGKFLTMDDLSNDKKYYSFNGVTSSGKEVTFTSYDVIPNGFPLDEKGSISKVQMVSYNNTNTSGSRDNMPSSGSKIQKDLLVVDPTVGNPASVKSDMAHKENQQGLFDSLDDTITADQGQEIIDIINEGC